MQRIGRKMCKIVTGIPKRKRVAGYTRVSSGKEAMLHSLSAQVSYYSEMIQNNPQWEYVGVYIDEAITGTKDSRAEFHRMIEDCKSGKIDMIVTKSISRFARNTVTMLEIVRELKAIGVDVFFEKENILVGSPKSRKTFWGEERLKSDINFANKQNQIADDGATRRCNAKFKNKEKCKTPHVTEEQIKVEFVKAVNSIIEGKEQVIKDCKELILGLTDTTLIEEKEIRLQSERSVLYSSIKELIEQNSHSKMDQIKYNERYEELKEKYDKVTEKLSKVEDLKCEKRTKKHRTEEFIIGLKQSSELLTDFDERLWYALIEKVIVNSDGRIEFEFKNGKIIE